MELEATQQDLLTLVSANFMQVLHIDFGTPKNLHVVGRLVENAPKSVKNPT